MDKKHEIPNEETKKAIKEVERMKENPNMGKEYNDADEMLKEMLDYINANCDYVDEQEQEEIESLNINFDDLSGKELTLDEIL